MKTIRIAGLIAVLCLGCAVAHAQDTTAERPGQKIKTKSNIKNDRAASPQTSAPQNTSASAGSGKTKSNVKNNLTTETPGAAGSEPARPDGGTKIRTKSNVKNDREAHGQGSTSSSESPAEAGRVKSHSNSTNNRQTQPGPSSTTH